MTFWIEWALAVHRAMWFPFHWITGLEQPAVQIPADLAPPVVRELDRPRRARPAALPRHGHQKQLPAV